MAELDGSRKGGYSLMELMVVIVLVSILTAVIVPQFAGTYQDALLRATGRELMSVMGLAYSQAVTLHTPHRLAVDPGARRYWLEALEGEGSARRFGPVLGVPASEGRLDERISVEIRPISGAMAREGGALSAAPQRRSARGGAGQEVISFRPDGTADAREIELRDREGYGLLLRVHPTTARVDVTELERMIP
ncbi:MAG: Tfp pilus assembly protein FimT/FimU [Planctomycetota bacterium]